MSFLRKEAVKLDVDAQSAIEAIQTAGDLLVQTGQVTPAYVNAMVDGFTEVGPYIVIAPGIAIPHARPEAGVYEQALSVIRLTSPLSFGHPANDPVQLVCAIAGKDQNSHLFMLRQISLVLGDPEKLSLIMHTSSIDEIVNLFSQTEVGGG
jgi:PTS system ascorbate-specific IIA component